MKTLFWYIKLAVNDFSWTLVSFFIIIGFISWPAAMIQTASDSDSNLYIALGFALSFGYATLGVVLMTLVFSIIYFFNHRSLAKEVGTSPKKIQVAILDFGWDVAYILENKDAFETLFEKELKKRA